MDPSSDEDDVIDVSTHGLYYYNGEVDLASSALPHGSPMRTFRAAPSAATVASATSTSQSIRSEPLYSPPYGMRFCKVPSHHRLGAPDHSQLSTSETFATPSPRIRNSLREILDTSGYAAAMASNCRTAIMASNCRAAVMASSSRAAAMASPSTNFLAMSPSSSVRAVTMAAHEAHKRRNASPSPSPTKRAREQAPRMYSTGEFGGRSRSSSANSPSTSSGRSNMSVSAKQMRETLRSAVLDDDLRRSVRNLEDERLKLRARLNEYKRRSERADQIKSHFEQQFGRIERENNRLARELDLERRDKDRILMEHQMQVAELKRQLDAANEKISRSEMDRAMAEFEFLERSANENLFQDMLGNFKELIENSLQCSVCSEVLIFASTVSCGHTFCEDCLEQWKSKSAIARPSCPICRADIRGQVSNIVLDNHIEKAVENFFPDDARRQRQELTADRRKKKEEREVAPPPAPPRRVRRTMSDLDSSSTESDDDHFPWAPANYNGINTMPGVHSPALPSSSDSSVLSRKPSTSFELSPTPSSTRGIGMRTAPNNAISDDDDDEDEEEEEENVVAVSYIVPSTDGYHFRDTTDEDDDDDDDYPFTRSAYLSHPAPAQGEEQPDTDEDEFGNLSSDAED